MAGINLERCKECGQYTCVTSGATPGWIFRQPGATDRAEGLIFNPLTGVSTSDVFVVQDGDQPGKIENLQRGSGCELIDPVIRGHNPRLRILPGPKGRVIDYSRDDGDWLR